MAATASPTPLPSTQSSSFYHRPPSRQPPRRTVSLSLRNRGSPYADDEFGPMLKSKKYSDGDSSDDDVPEPIKFSASVKALLGEDASGLDTSPRHRRFDNNEAPSKSVNNEKSSQNAPVQERQVRIVSPAPRSSGSPSPRVVRVGSASRSSPNATSKESSFIQRDEGSPSSAAGQSRGDLITPAPRTRSVRVTGSRSHTRSSSSTSPTGSRATSRAFLEESRLGDKSFSGDDQQKKPADDDGGRSGASSVLRSRNGEEPGVQNSQRVKRVGRLTGSFLKGPARRGVIRRQSGDEPDLPLDETPETDIRPSKSEQPQPSVHQAAESSEKEYRSPRYLENDHNSPQLRQTPKFSSSSDRPVRDVPMRTVSPNVLGANPKPTSASRHDGSPKLSSNAQPAYQVPPPLPSMPATRDQENEPPPTFKRSKPHGFSLLDKAEKFSVIYDEDKPSSKPPASASPRKPLAPRNNNTPHRPAPQPPPKMSVLETATATAGAASSSQSRRKRAQVTINKKNFTRLDCIGRGGSSRVYRVMAENCKIFALKRVNLEDVDSLALAGYKGEIDLLRKLEKVDRVVQLFDYEINEEKHSLNMLMEMGESDLYKTLTLKLNAEDAVFDSVFTRYYWKEMLECVQAVHDFDIVHSDLKPANFLLVKGNLKLIDFGIANAIQDHTVNVHREQQIGTPNYMSPEALVDCNAASGLPSSVGKMMKLGKPSDVWSLGCILYQMVYGKPPFAHITRPYERIMSIPNPKVVIDFPPFGVGGVPVPNGLIRTLKGCLQRDPSLRPTVKQLLDQSDPFLYPEAYLQGTVPISQDMLERILLNVVQHCRTKGPPNDEEMARWPAGFFAKIKAAVEANEI